MLNTKDLKAIRRRAGTPATLGLVAQHSQAVADRAALLVYVDAVEAEITKLGDSVTGALEASRLLLALRLVEDGHAKNIGDGLRLAGDLDAVRGFYPDAGA